jgi:P-aminobenzoate N-oxygenase AurF
MTALAQALVQLGQFSQRLSRVSARTYQNPYTALDWPDTLNAEAGWFTSEELLSLHGTGYWDELAEPERRRLSLLEAANFYSLNIHGEKSLMSGLAARLYRPDLLDFTSYLHHFLDEENKHSVYFGGFCTRYAKVYRSRQVPVAGDDRPRDVEDFLFFAKAMAFEEIVDYYNQLQARDARLHPVARFINDNHHREETRHLVFGRALVSALWQAADWDTATRADLGDQLTEFLLASWREYYNPDVYADLGLADPWGAAEAAWASQAQRRHRRLASARCLGFLISLGVLPKEVTDAV